jgi:CHAT domain
VLATLWLVDDLATCLLLGKFFELWERGHKSAAEALRAAQKWLRAEVTVEDVTEKMADWLDRASDVDEALEVQHGMWAARPDRTARPFRDELYWAGFYVTAVLIKIDPVADTQHGQTSLPHLRALAHVAPRLSPPPVLPGCAPPTYALCPLSC